MRRREKTGSRWTLMCLSGLLATACQASSPPSPPRALPHASRCAACHAVPEVHSLAGESLPKLWKNHAQRVPLTPSQREEVEHWLKKP